MSDIGSFSKGNFLQTIYEESYDGFSHCVGNDTDASSVFSASGFAEEIVPRFFGNSETIICDNSEQQY